MNKPSSKILVSIILIVITLLLGYCKKPERVIKVITLDVSTSDISYDTVFIKGEIIDPGGSPLTDHGISIRNTAESENNFTELSLGRAQGEGVFQAILKDPLPGTTYEYTAYAGNGSETVHGKPKTFTTPDISLPELTTTPVTEITYTAAKSGGNITSDGGSEITARGICWSTETEPDSTAHKTIDPNPGPGEFINHLAWLSPDTVYYVRAYAANEAGIAYGKQVSFRTLTPETPTVLTELPQDITTNSATLSGEVVSDGGSDVFDRGFCWSETSTPDHNDNVIQNNQNGTGTFSEAISGLAEGTFYYARAFATNSVGTRYGNEISFTTHGPPVIELSPATGITAYTAVITANITNDGGNAVYERGLCYSTDPNPDTNSAVTDDQSGDGEFTMELTGLTENTKYYVRAYAINGYGESYSNEIQFTTLAYNNTGTFTDARDGTEYKWVEIGSQKWMAENLKYLPSVSPPDVSSYTDPHYYVYDYMGSDPVSAKATSNYTTYGVLYNWYSAMEGAVSNDDNPGAIEGVCPDGWHLPSDSEWKELEIYLGMTSEDAELTGQRGDISGMLKEAGTEHWYQTSASVTNGSGFTALPGGKRNYNDEFNGLNYEAYFWSSTEVDITYSFDRVIDYNSGSVYRNNTNKNHGLSVRCIQGPGASLPEVATNDPYNIHTDSATVGGEITFEGNSTISERGVYYGTATDPVTNGTKLILGSGPGLFETNLKGLTHSQTYYVKAFATNIAGTVYGEELSFTTITAEVPTVTTVSVNSITGTTAEVTGNVIDNGSSIADDRGFCYNTSGSPTITDDIVQNHENGTGEFTETIEGLSPGTTYYVRAYGTNYEGTGYGSEVSFVTEAELVVPTLTTNEASSVTHTTAESGGIISDDGGSSVTERGVCWSTDQNPTTVDNKTSDGTGTGTFTSEITGLDPGTTYYVRAYATNSIGTAYGQQVSFTTTGDNTTVVDVSNPATGKIWMDRNLGASRAATSSTDEEAYGHLYQWGRAADGHQLRTSVTTTTLSSNDSPGHGDFILAPDDPYDWRSPQNDNLWQGVSGTNNPCPAGYRLPTQTEWEAEMASWDSEDAAGAFASPLKLPVAGFRYYSSGSLYDVGSYGYYWSSTVDGTSSRSLYLYSSVAAMYSDRRAYGNSVRCLKE